MRVELRLRLPLASLLLSVCFLVTAAGSAGAAPYSWNVASGDWFTATNWDPNGVPGPGDDVTISNNGTCTLDAAASIGNFTQSNGTFTGTGTLTVGGLLTMTGGTMGGTGTTNGNGGMALAANGGPVLRRTLNNAGTAVVTGASTFYLDSAPSSGTAGILQNLAGGTLDVQGNGSFGWLVAPGTINNAGLLQKSSGTGASRIRALFNNTGTVAAQSGTLEFDNYGTGTHTGAFTVSTGTTLRLVGGGHSLTAAASISGAGNVVFAGAVNHAGSYAVTGTTTALGGTTNFTGSVTAVGALIVSGGTPNFSNTEGGIAPTTLTISKGALTGSSSVNVNGLLTWTDGGMSGTGVTNANGGMAITAAPGTTLGRTLNNAGTAIVTGTNAQIFEIDSGGILNNLAGATLDVQGTFEIEGGGTINNVGLLQTSSGTGTLIIQARLNNAGTFAVQSGTVEFYEDGTHTGAITVAAGTTLKFTDGTHGLSEAGSISGAGNVVVGFFAGSTDATVNHAGSYAVSGTTTVYSTANFTGSAAMGALTFSRGTLSGSGDVNVSGLLTWTDGVMAGTGVTNATGGMTLNTVNGGRPTLRRTLNNAGTAIVTGTNAINVENSTTAGVLNNLTGATIDVQGNGGFSWLVAPGTINNAGLFQKSGGGGTSSIHVPYNNSGITSAANGLLSFGSTAPFTQTAGTTRLNGGSISSTNPINIHGGTLEGTGTLTATVNNTGGTLAPGLSAGRLNETGSYTQGTSGAFTVEIGGLTVGSGYDRAAISGVATLAGTLNISLINGYEPNVGDTFTIMTFGSRTGDFGTVNGTFIAPGKTFLKTVSGTNVALVVVAVATPTPTATVTVTATSTATSTPTLSATPTPGETSTTTPTVTVTPTATETATLTPTASATPTQTPTPTRTATPTPTETRTPTPTATPSMTSTPTPVVTATATPFPLDHFTCYQVKPGAGGSVFTGITNPPGVALEDRFGTSVVTVKKTMRLCVPTQKNAEPPPASPDEHVITYQVRPAVRFLKVRDQLIVDQFGMRHYDVLKPAELMVPTARDLAMAPPPLVDPVTPHFQCYKVKDLETTGRFLPVTVTLDDLQALQVTVRKPTRLCTPADQNGEDPSAPDHPEHLMCYQVRDQRVPAFTPVLGNFTANQFADQALDVRKPAELCVPAVVNP